MNEGQRDEMEVVVERRESTYRRTGKPGNWKYLAGLGLASDFISLNFDELQSFMISESISDKSWHSKS